MQITATNQLSHAPTIARGATTAPASGRGMLLAGRVVTGLVSVFLLFDGVARLVRFAPYVEGTVRFGYPEHLASPIGLALTLCTLLYLIPRTAVVGAILLTGYLGGATASHVRVEDPFFLFAVAFGVLVWAGLYLREPRLRALLQRA
jgi:hypothetical protein